MRIDGVRSQGVFRRASPSGRHALISNLAIDRRMMTTRWSNSSYRRREHPNFPMKAEAIQGKAILRRYCLPERGTTRSVVCDARGIGRTIETHRDGDLIRDSRCARCGASERVYWAEAQSYARMSAGDLIRMSGTKEAPRVAAKEVASANSAGMIASLCETPSSLLRPNTSLGVGKTA